MSNEEKKKKHHANVLLGKKLGDLTLTSDEMIFARNDDSGDLRVSSWLWSDVASVTLSAEPALRHRAKFTFVDENKKPKRIVLTDHSQVQRMKRDIHELLGSGAPDMYVDELDESTPEWTEDSADFAMRTIPNLSANHPSASLVEEKADPRRGHGYPIEVPVFEEETEVLVDEASTPSTDSTMQRDKDGSPLSTSSELLLAPIPELSSSKRLAKDGGERQQIRTRICIDIVIGLLMLALGIGMGVAIGRKRPAGGDGPHPPTSTSHPVLNSTSTPISGPTAAPSFLSGTQPPIPPNVQYVFVNSSFLVASTSGVKAAVQALQDSSINLAFQSFSRTVTSGMGATRSLLGRNAQGRRLAVRYHPSSAELYRAIEIECEQDVFADSCSVILGRYGLQVENENAQDVYRTYVTATKARIDNGGLEQALQKVDPSSGFLVLGSSDVVDDSFNPYPSSTNLPVSTTAPIGCPSTLAPSMMASVRKTVMPTAMPSSSTKLPVSTTAPSAPPTFAPTSPVLDTWLSYSFFPDPDEPYFVGHKRQIFRLTEDDVDTKVKTTSENEEVISETIEETANSFSAKLGVEGSYGAFSASASISTSSMNQNKVKIVRIDKVTTAEKYVSTLKDPYSHRRLLPAARTFFLEETPEKIMDTMGSFFAEQITVGGVFQFSAVTEKSERVSKQDVKSEFEAAYGNGAMAIAGKGEVGSGEETYGSCLKMTFSYTVQGGDTTIWLQSNDGKELQNLWAASVHDGNMHPTKYRLRPIWELLDHEEMNKTKAAELKEHMLTVWKGAGGDKSDVGFDFAEDNRVKRPEGSVTIRQPEEENGSYEHRSFSRDPCDLIGAYNDNEKKGCWDLDDMVCPGNPQYCLKWGFMCYAGRIDLPEGVNVDVYKIDGHWGNICSRGGLLHTFRGPAAKEFWNPNQRACAFRFYESEGYSCGPNPGCL